MARTDWSKGLGQFALSLILAVIMWSECHLHLLALHEDLQLESQADTIG